MVLRINCMSKLCTVLQSAMRCSIQAGVSTSAEYSGFSSNTSALHEFSSTTCFVNPVCVVPPNHSVDNVDAETNSLDDTDSVLNIDMLPRSLHRRIFGTCPTKVGDLREKANKLKQLGVDTDGKKGTDTVLRSALQRLDLPADLLEGCNVADHFHRIGEEQVRVYRELLDQLCLHKCPPKPSEWILQSGWTRYDSDGNVKRVAFPLEQAIVFDVEVCVSQGPAAVLACAMSSEAWYSWCSEDLVNATEEQLIAGPESLHYNIPLNKLIPLEASLAAVYKDIEQIERIVVGHNVSYDRSRVREQYFAESTKLRFLDTMALHIAVCGLGGDQRILYSASVNRADEHGKGDLNPWDFKNKAVKDALRYNEESMLKFKHGAPSWVNVTSTNSLAAVHALHCRDQPQPNKATRDVFMTASLHDVQSQFQNLASYCADDVAATTNVLKALLPRFFAACPHPVTFAGMLEMSVTYLPVNESWSKYIQTAEAEYAAYNDEQSRSLMSLANEAWKLVEDNQYMSDPWLWDADFSTNSGLMPGYPKWFRDLCPTKQRDNPQPTKISAKTHITPKLLGLCWDGYPLFHHPTDGWGYLAPKQYSSDDEEQKDLAKYEKSDNLQNGYIVYIKRGRKDNVVALDFPHAQIKALVQRNKSAPMEALAADGNVSDMSRQRFEGIEKGYGLEQDAMRRAAVMAAADKVPKLLSKPLKELSDQSESGSVKYVDLFDFPGFEFRKLPHKHGVEDNVGSPLSQDFLRYIEQGRLVSHNPKFAKRIARNSATVSYWKNNRERVKEQIVVWQDSNDGSRVGAIIPKAVTAGTVTRRAVEATWMTASNAKSDRLGSELKGMIQAPMGYSFVGADVDSQELWIAATLGDSYDPLKLPGCTALSSMLLKGTKEAGTDQHSVIAKELGVSRDQAKVLNYGRIYGAGEKFAVTLLMQFNPNLSNAEAKAKAKALYARTKGKRRAKVRVKYLEEASDLTTDGKQFVNLNDDPKTPVFSQSLIKTMERSLKKSTAELVEDDVWVGGLESDMFNCLEKVARSSEPRTPVLKCKLSDALLPANVGEDFLPSRINWVVQSSAVDYLHLMLCSMRWLRDKYDIQTRFAISIHDEVRYLVASPDRYRCALALQVTNLLTRAMFTHALGMDRLPMSVAFFSQVDVDKVLRKDPNDECVTPSNPLGLSSVDAYGIGKGECLSMADLLNKCTSLMKQQ